MLRVAVSRHRAEILTVKGHDGTQGGTAEPVRLLQDRVEHRRQIAGRSVDDLQHLGGRGLLLQRLPLLGHQPRILHRDHRLGGEVLQQRDLLVGERPNLLAIDRDAAEQRLVLAQRHGEQRASTTKIDECAAIGFACSVVVGVRQIRNVDQRLAPSATASLVRCPAQNRPDSEP